jgi:4-hydroxybenzoate polyprenyltransferase
LFWFLIISYVNGIVIEVGRKTRVPADEETGVETYSALWGTNVAVRVWLAAVIVTAFAAWRAAALIGTDAPMLSLLLVLVAICGVAALRVVRRRTPGSGKAIELVSACGRS